MKKAFADMDPLEEIRAIREEISREFKTIGAYGEYLRKKYPNVNTTMGASNSGCDMTKKPHLSGTPKTPKKLSGQRKSAKRVATS